MYGKNEIDRLYELYQQEGILGPINGIKRHLKYDYIKSSRYYWYRYVSGPTEVREIYGSDMELDIRKKGVNQDLMIDGEREPQSIRYYESILNNISDSFDDMLVLDIGANIGHMALLEAKSCPNSTVWAIEPDPRNIEDLSKNIRLNSYDNIQVDQLAIGANSGEKHLQLAEQPNLNKMTDISDDDLGSERKVQVDVVTVDSLIERADIDESVPVILRMDTEGYETKILDGASELLKSNRPIYVFIELHHNLLSKEEMKNLISLLESAGLEVDQVRDGPGLLKQPLGFEWDTVRPPSGYEDQFGAIHLFAHRSIF